MEDRVYLSGLQSGVFTLEEMQRAGARNRLRPAFDTELAEEMIDVFFDRGDADHESFGDLLVG